MFVFAQALCDSEPYIAMLLNNRIEESVRPTDGSNFQFSKVPL